VVLVAFGGLVAIGLTATVISYLPYLVFMFIGTAINFHWRRQLGSRALGFAVALLFGAAALAHWSVAGDNIRGLAAAYPLAVLVFLGSYAMRDRFTRLTALRWLAQVSYPLYVVHTIPGFVLMRALVDNGVGSDVAVISAIGLTLGVAFIVHRTVERPTQTIGKRQARILSAAGSAGTGSDLGEPSQAAAPVGRMFSTPKRLPATTPLVARPATLR
jgi:peptidoglycan/LPS O-acetylase OafA/YrhL